MTEKSKLLTTGWGRNRVAKQTIFLSRVYLLLLNRVQVAEEGATRACCILAEKCCRFFCFNFGFGCFATIFILLILRLFFLLCALRWQFNSSESTSGDRLEHWDIAGRLTKQVRCSRGGSCLNFAEFNTSKGTSSSWRELLLTTSKQILVLSRYCCWLSSLSRCRTWFSISCSGCK